ncbi:MAG: glycosyltransferase family 4 protein, partial [Terriglobales bacterium]
HEVSVVHPRQLAYSAPEPPTLRQRLRRKFHSLLMTDSNPTITWLPVDKRVQSLFVPSSHSRFLPDSDVLFATSWHTVNSVLKCPATKGEKCYLIQHYETWQGRKDLVDATWRAPLHKVVIAKWLLEKGEELGCSDLTYISNAVNHDTYRLTRPIQNRPRRVAMMFSTEEFKGSRDGLKALAIARRIFPDLEAVLFSTSRRQSWVPGWVEYFRNPPQNFIVNEIFGGSSVFLCPSLSEGWGLPPAEAAACGCAIVSTDNGGIREFLEHRVTGLLSPPADPESLAENLCLLLENESLRIRLAEAGNKYVSQLNWDKSADLMEDFVEGVCSLKYEHSQEHSRVL